MRQKEKHFASKEKSIGQFLTPPEVAHFIVRFVALNTGRKVGIDPSCGDGVFLKALMDQGFREVIGIDIDEEILYKLPNAIKRKAKLFMRDGLQCFLGDITNTANAVVGNPPFSAKYGRVRDQRVLSTFQLGKGRKSQAIEILFLERFIQLASPRGTIGIILPAGIFSALPLRYVRKFILDNSTVLGIVSLPRGIFNRNTTSKCSILFAQKGKSKRETFMGIADGLDSLSSLLDAYTKHKECERPVAFWVSNLSADSFDPEFYQPCKVSAMLQASSLPIVRLGQVLSAIHCGGTEYGDKRRFADEGIPFISAKTVTPLGLNLDRDRRYVEPNSIMDKKWAHVHCGDILFVRVGVGCSGRAAVVVDDSEKGIADDWIYILRAKGVSPYYIALFLYTKFGQSQIERLKRGVGTVTIPQRLLKDILIPIPSPIFQENLEKHYHEMVKLRRAMRIVEATAKFNELIHDIEAAIRSNSPVGEKN
jgi:type I restriction enzyme M protein